MRGQLLDDRKKKGGDRGRRVMSLRRPELRKLVYNEIAVYLRDDDDDFGRRKGIRG